MNVLGSKDGLVHISELAPRHVGRVEDVVKDGDRVTVKVMGDRRPRQGAPQHEGGRPADRRGHLGEAGRAGAGWRVNYRTVMRTAASGPPFFVCRLCGNDQALNPLPSRSARWRWSRRRPAAAAAAVRLRRRPGPTPTQTEGPFYPTGFPADTDNDLVQVRGQQARAMGEVLHLEGRVLDVTASRSTAPWSRSGSATRRASTTTRATPAASGATAFQGYRPLAGRTEGRYRFRTLKPVAYPGRTPHIHLKVATRDGRTAHDPVLRGGRPRQRA